jgi:hypothetical protein
MRARAVVFWAVAIGLVAPASSFSQGLGDAAKREKARRAEAKPADPARIYTNDSVGGNPTNGTYSAPGGTAAPPAGSGAAGSPGAPRPVRPAGAGSAPSSGGSEAYWRGRAASARAAVDSAEERVAQLEAESARNGPYTPGQTAGACTEGTMPLAGESTIALRDRAKGSKTCDAEVLRIQNSQRLHGEVEAARTRLDALRKALVDLEDEARKAGALPGWLR